MLIRRQNISRFVLPVLLLLLAAAPAWSQGAPELKKDVVEGYAKPEYNELLQTIVVLGGYNIDDPKVAQAYAKQIYCPLYRQYYADDFSWNAQKENIVNRVKAKKEPYRIQYEYSGVMQLERYDPVAKAFPLSQASRMVNVGHMEVITSSMVRGLLCLVGNKEEDSRDPFFPVQIGLTLTNPLTLTEMPIAPEKGEVLLSKLQARGVNDRSVFVRFRFRVVDQPHLVRNRNDEVVRADLVGQLQAIDFFLDRDLTIWVASAPVPK